MAVKLADIAGKMQDDFMNMKWVWSNFVVLPAELVGWIQGDRYGVSSEDAESCDLDGVVLPIICMGGLYVSLYTLTLLAFYCHA